MEIAGRRTKYTKIENEAPDYKRNKREKRRCAVPWGVRPEAVKKKKRGRVFLAGTWERGTRVVGVRQKIGWGSWK